jgi:CheY-like chemotaxis protein
MNVPTILVVEDDPINRELMVELLTGYGYEVFEAKDGKSAIDIVRAQRPRVILMDLGLPGLDGIETTRRLKADPILRSIPIVIVTAHGQFKEPLARAAGCDGFITKPISRSMLLDTVARFIT